MWPIPGRRWKRLGGLQPVADRARTRSSVLSPSWKTTQTTDIATDSRQRARRQKALSDQGATHPRPSDVTEPLKVTRSEAELHVLKARLRGGILRHARRGELKQIVPVGFVHDAQDRTVLDPDAQVQATFKRTGSCLAVVKEFHTKELLFPRRLRCGPHKDELVWVKLLHCRARQIIHNLRYAGAFVLGRTKQRKLPNGKTCSRLVPSEEWILLRDMHLAYITWEVHQSNLKRVKGSAVA